MAWLAATVAWQLFLPLTHLDVQLQQPTVLSFAVGAVQPAPQLLHQLAKVLLQLLAGAKSCKRCRKGIQRAAQVDAVVCQLLRQAVAMEEGIHRPYLC